MRRLFVLLAFAAYAVAPAAAAERPWIDLLKGDSYDAFKPNKAKEGDYIWAESVSLEEKSQKTLIAKPGKAGILVNGVKGRSPDLLTKLEYGDLEVEVEFMIAKGSNSGIKFHAVYEIQILDTYGKDKLTGDSMGGIYPRAEDKPKYHHIDDGIPPLVNAAKPAGEWNRMQVIFIAAKFDAAGKKMANAKILKAMLNDKLVQNDQEMKTPTGSNYVRPEKAKGPFMLQLDHGPVAFRNVRIREYDAK